MEEVISVATIREPFGRRFQTTGLDSTDEAHNLALLLRSGALAAPIQIVEERTVGPSLGQDNIDQGMLLGADRLPRWSCVFMGFYYRVLRAGRQSGAAAESGADRGGPGPCWARP